MKFGLSHKKDREASEDEKVVGVKAGDLEALGHGELPPDPEADLSDEELAKIVGSCLIFFRIFE